MAASSGIAMDGSGNIWISNAGSNTVTQRIGTATPAAIPLSAMKPGVEP